MRRYWVLAAALAYLPSWQGGPAWSSDEFPVPPPPFTEGIYPCSDCHEGQEPNPTPRVLEDEHVDIELHHAEQFRWCLDCHDEGDRDKLRLQSGERIDFSESYRLCGQCHGDKYRDWKRGVHGKRTGQWNGPKKYLLCANCHNPHSPRFALKANPEFSDAEDGQPEPPPLLPGTGTLRSAGAGHDGPKGH